MAEIKRKLPKYPVEVTPEMKRRIAELNQDVYESARIRKKLARLERNLAAENVSKAIEYDYPYIKTLQRKERNSHVRK